IDDRVALDVLHVPQGADRLGGDRVLRDIGPRDSAHVQGTGPREICVDVEDGHDTRHYVWRRASGSRRAQPALWSFWGRLSSCWWRGGLPRSVIGVVSASPV